MGATRVRRRDEVWTALDNEELLRRCSEHDAGAWRELVRRYERLVYSIPIREGLSRDQASDVAQATFGYLCASIDKIREPDRLAWWLMTVARREVWRVREGRIVQPHRPEEVPDIAVDEDFVEPYLRTMWVHDAVMRLDEPCRSIITEIFLAPTEPSYAEIAATVSMSVGSIGPMRHRCLTRLRRVLEPGGEWTESQGESQ